ncbi:hypothetical protein GCM10007876_36830 [Litoribrevibacter albus]|uniref:Bacterial sugar transferase domain-containing protein n=2 Tax=Litoribrevibacter albus TaxID=1473156 RepID=A0AA37SDJ0_9GAMM|nr:hypothetical protein GCM10007876_36830 [Litoribrevibacter albus]
MTESPSTPLAFASDKEPLPSNSKQNSSHTFSKSMIFIFCPLDQEEIISKILQQHSIPHYINNYERVTEGADIFHYESKRLSTEQKEFLIEKIKYGHLVEPLIDFLDRKLGYTEVELLNSDYYLHRKSFSILRERKKDASKRLTDILLSVLIAIPALILGIIAAIAIKLDSPGPIFYRQKRVGRYNKEFEVIKFRSMAIDAEKNGAQYAKKNDSRVTRVGNFIRKTRIDELPQIINVLRNEMSFIGPRPERAVFIEKLEQEIPFYRFRHAVKPGITGLAQVKYRYGETIEDAKCKHRYDTYYIKHQNLILDFKIVALTIKTVLFGMGQ